MNFNKGQKKYVFLGLLLFLVEAIIALFFEDSFIRPVVGDYLVVILIYCVIRAFTKFEIVPVAIGVLLFAFFIEFLQWIHLLDRLNIERNLFTDLTLGSGFDWKDLVAYTLGILTVLALERFSVRRKRTSSDQ